MKSEIPDDILSRSNLNETTTSFGNGETTHSLTNAALQTGSFVEGIVAEIPDFSTVTDCSGFFAEHEPVKKYFNHPGKKTRITVG